jgi:hypothetical protein
MKIFSGICIVLLLNRQKYFMAASHIFTIVILLATIGTGTYLLWKNNLAALYNLSQSACLGNSIDRL